MSSGGSTRFSETVSEKRKRGRPKGPYAGFVEEAASIMRPDVKTYRGKQNAALAGDTINELRLAWEQPFAWFYGLPPCDLDKVGAGRRVRWTVFTELGRNQGYETRMALARELSKLPLSTTSRAAVARLRRWRLGNEVGTAPGLAAALYAALFEYWNRFPKTSKAVVDDAIRRLQATVDASTESEVTP